MKDRTIIFALAALLSIAAAPVLAQDASGTWLTESGETRVRIAPCGGNYCGTVVWQKTPGKDVNNPDASKKNRPVVGINMFTGKKSGDGEWTGQLYNFQEGKTYNGKLKVSGPNALTLSGCIMGGIICRSQTWTRVGG
jgi:uncharacterized protein (DUF2147 family)